jgi:raffinose/stachyose/melibiose transport system permease protein
MSEMTAKKSTRTHKRKRIRWGNAWKQIVLVLFAIACIFPVYYMFVTSFKSDAEYLVNRFSIPLKPIMENFFEVLKGETFPRWFLNSIILTGGSIAFNTIIASLAAFAFAKMSFKNRDTIFSFILTLMVVPPVVMVIPLFKLMIQLHILNTYASVILIYVGLTLPFSIYMLTNFFKTIPDEIMSSARIDGCPDIIILRKIILPLAAPAIITIILVNALWVWNELLIAVIFLQRDELKTLMVGLTVFKSRYNLDIPATMSGLVLATIPMLALYFAGQKYFIKGMVSGSLK